MDHSSTDGFIETWGSMGMLWGLNRSIARVHALLIVSEEPLSLDQIADRLEISRGNASMCLKELRSWKVVQRVPVAGDRRDFYATEPDVWRMFFRIMRERKRREFDPLLDTIHAALGEADQEAEGAALKRLRQMEELLLTMERMMTRFLSNERTSRAMMHFLTSPIPGLDS